MEDLSMSGKFIKTIRFSQLLGYWKKPKPTKPISDFIRLNVTCSNYGFTCKSEEFYEKENWRKFKQYLSKHGWMVIGSLVYCPDRYQKELER